MISLVTKCGKKIFIFLFLSISLSGQVNTDSLKLALKNAKHDTTRCAILTTLIEMEMDDEVWPKFNEQLLKLAHAGLAANPSKTIKIFYIKQKAYAFNNIGVLANSHGDANKAIIYYNKALELQEEIKDKLGTANTLNNIGYVYHHLGDIPKALECYHKCLKISEEIDNKVGVSTVLNNLGLLYVNQDETAKAIEYYKRSLKICEEINDVQGIGSALNNIGSAYDNVKEGNQAMEYYNKSLNVYKTYNDKLGIATVLNNIGLNYHEKNKLKEALNCYLQSLALHEEIMNESDIVYTASNIATLKLHQGLIDEAYVYAMKSYTAAIELGYPDNINTAANILRIVYRKQNKYKEALEMYELEIKMRDSINNQETKRLAIKKQFQYTYEKQAAQDSIKHAEEQKVKNAELLAQEAQFSQEKTQRFVLYGGLVLVIMLSGFVFNRFRVTQKQKAIIAEQKVHVDLAYDKLHVKNKEVMDSISYARRIQNSLLPTEKYISKKLNGR